MTVWKDTFYLSVEEDDIAIFFTDLDNIHYYDDPNDDHFFDDISNFKCGKIPYPGGYYGLGYNRSTVFSSRIVIP